MADGLQRPPRPRYKRRVLRQPRPTSSQQMINRPNQRYATNKPSPVPVSPRPRVPVAKTFPEASDLLVKVVQSYLLAPLLTIDYLLADMRSDVVDGDNNNNRNHLSVVATIFAAEKVVTDQSERALARRSFIIHFSNPWSPLVQYTCKYSSFHQRIARRTRFFFRIALIRAHSSMIGPKIKPAGKSPVSGPLTNYL